MDRTKSNLQRSATMTTDGESNAAQQCLKGLTEEAASKQTMAAWRLSDDKIKNLLESFAAEQDWTTIDDLESVQKQVQTTLFSPLNKFLWEQERTIEDETTPIATVDPENSLHIVFGGKYAPTESAYSISECMINILVSAKCKHIMTVSRSNVDKDKLPSCITHVVKQRLDQPGGDKEFQDVMEQGLQQLRTTMKESSATVVLYFTLGQHKGVDPFRRNVAAAQNFATALQTFDGDFNIQVVMTGTDATLPSTHPDSQLVVQGQTFAVPTYKISAYNFVYAMSKLCQFYIVADAVHEIVKNDETSGSSSSWKEDTAKMKAAVEAAGQDGNYNPAHGMTMEELDRISTNCAVLESDHFKIAKGISISYTPLHRIPWTEASFVKSAAEAKGSPRGYILQQVVRRLKNAMSVNKAAGKHF